MKQFDLLFLSVYTYEMANSETVSGVLLAVSDLSGQTLCIGVGRGGPGGGPIILEGGPTYPVPPQ